MKNNKKEIFINATPHLLWVGEIFEIKQKWGDIEIVGDLPRALSEQLSEMPTASDMTKSADDMVDYLAGFKNKHIILYLPMGYPMFVYLLGKKLSKYKNVTVVFSELQKTSGDVNKLNWFVF